MRKIICVFAAVVVVCLFSGFGAVAQDNAGDAGVAAGGTAKFGKAAIRERTIKEALGVTDEEWKVLDAKIETVRTLMKKGHLTIFGSKKKGSGKDGGEPPSELDKKILDLQKLAENRDVDARTVKDKLKEFRDARDRSKADLKKAQDELRELLTPRQEVQMILMGLLD